MRKRCHKCGQIQSEPDIIHRILETERLIKMDLWVDELFHRVKDCCATQRTALHFTPPEKTSLPFPLLHALHGRQLPL